MNYDFGELKNDTSFVSKVQTCREAIEKIEKKIQEAMEMKNDELSDEQKLNLEIYLTYAVNSLYFMYLRVNGDNLATHPIKHELSRIKEAMERQKQIAEKHLRPKVDLPAAKRFVKGGLYDHKQKNEEFRKKQPQKIFIHGNPNPQNRKRKFNDD
jgi:exosome complex protein LRP1